MAAPPRRRIVADAGYASDAVYTDLAKQRIEAFIPPQPNILKRAQAARARCKTARGVGAAIDRITHGEGAIAELKRHGAGRARCRATAKLQIQLLLAATAINLKRLTTHLPAAENDWASDKTAVRVHLAILNGCLRALTADHGATSTTGSSAARCASSTSSSRCHRRGRARSASIETSVENDFLCGSAREAIAGSATT